MKQMVEILEEIDGYTVIRGFDVCIGDPEATRVAIENQIRNNPALAAIDRETLFDTYAEYPPILDKGESSLRKPNTQNARRSLTRLENISA